MSAEVKKEKDVLDLNWDTWVRIAAYLFLANYMPPLGAALVMILGEFVFHTVICLGGLILSMFDAEIAKPATAAPSNKTARPL